MLPLKEITDGKLRGKTIKHNFICKRKKCKAKKVQCYWKHSLYKNPLVNFQNRIMHILIVLQFKKKET